MANKVLNYIDIHLSQHKISWNHYTLANKMITIHDPLTQAQVMYYSRMHEIPKYSQMLSFLKQGEKKIEKGM